MRHPKLTPILLPFLAAAFQAPAQAGEAPAAPAAEVKEEALVAERGELQVLIETEGTLDVVRRKRLKVVPEEFPGPYGVLEILPSGQLVESGAVLVRLETVTLDRLIRGAAEALEAAKIKAQATREDLETLKTANRLKLERSTQELKQAERDLKSFDKFGEEQMLQGKELALKQQEAWQSNREEELAQLEKMYKEAQLASETKEIVLQRARRDVALGREGLGLNRKSEKQLKEFDHPNQKEKLNRTVEQKREDLELFKAAVKSGELQKSEELKAADRAVRDASERLTRLENDLGQMAVRAPFAGVFRHGGIEVGDKIAPHAPFADFLDLNRFEVKFLLTLRDLQAVRAGDKLQVRLPELPEVELEGKVEEIALTASPEGQDKGPPRYPVRAKVDDNKLLRQGARVRIEIRGEKLKKVLAIPRTAVSYEDGRAYCKVRTDKGVAKREIGLGLGDRERVHVVRGLADGETVIIKEGKK